MLKTWRITGSCRGSERVLPLESLGPVAARFNQNRSVVPASGLSHRTMEAPDPSCDAARAADPQRGGGTWRTVIAQRFLRVSPPTPFARRSSSAGSRFEARAALSATVTHSCELDVEEHCRRLRGNVR